jgi:two-component system response regulator PilR (NtrC family)
MATQAIEYRHPIFNSGNRKAVVDQTSEPSGEFIGVSKWADNARDLIALHSSHGRPVILEGEMGTGRRLLAKLIHRSSAFREGPFISLRLGSASDEMAQAVITGMLGGWELDASTVQSLSGSTVYIEDLSNSSMYVCDGILRLSSRIGSQTIQPFRILMGRTVQSRREPWLAATIATDGLECERIQIPALRHRPEDIEPLVAHFIRQHCEENQRELRDLTPEAIEALRAYDWPRNISELKTLVIRLLSQLKPPCIDASQLPSYLNPFRSAGQSLSMDLSSEVERFEISLICTALRNCNGQQNRAARVLGIKPTTLFMKLKRYGIDADRFKTNYRPKPSAPSLGDRVFEEAH